MASLLATKVDRTAGYPKWLKYYMFEIRVGGTNDAATRQAMMDDYADKVGTSLKTVGRVTDKSVHMAWREGKTLHVRNPAAFNRSFPADATATGWKRGVQEIRDGAAISAKDRALADFPMTYFDKVVIHNSAPEEQTSQSNTIIDLSYGDARDTHALGRP